MTRLRIWNCILILALLLSPSWRPATAQSCAPNCSIFLPGVDKLVQPPPPLQVAATGGTWFRGGIEIDGNIETTGNVPIYNAVLEVKWFDHAGYNLGTTPGYIALPATFPGHLNYFFSSIADVSARDGFQQFVFKSWSLHSDQAYAPLTVVDKQLKVSSINPFVTELKIYALIRNDQATTVKNIQVAIWQINVTESYYLTSVSPIPDTIAPGETFTVTETYSISCCNQPFRLTPDIAQPLNVEAQGILQP